MFARKKMSENVAPLGVNVGLGKNAVEGPNKGAPGKLKRTAAFGQVKRSALGDIANTSNEKINIPDGKKKITAAVKATKPAPAAKPKTTTKASTAVAPAAKAVSKPVAVTTTTNAAAKKKVVTIKKGEVKEEAAPRPQLQKKTRVQELIPKQDLLLESANTIDLDGSLPLERVEEDISVIETEGSSDLCAFDSENYNDVFHVANYAQDIFDYYKEREKQFEIRPYIQSGDYPITPTMRAILVDWMVEIQENFELNHETLYLGVKLTDTYLSRTTVTKDSLQLVGAVSLFVASKFDEQRYPLIEDFTFVCDNAFNSHQFLQMEMDLLKRIDFDLGIPLSYRFLRRYAKVGKLSTQTLTLARYILELSLMESEFVSERDSKMAAAALYLAMKMRHEGQWTGDLVKTSGYEWRDFNVQAAGLNEMLRGPASPQLSVVRCKYSHIVFHEVAKIPLIKTEKLFL